MTSGLTRCISGVTRNPNNALEAVVALDPIPSSAAIYRTGDVLSFRVLTRIGTNSDDTQCLGHKNAVGLRLYYGGLQRPSGFGAELTPNPLRDFYLHSSGSVNFLNSVAPTPVTPRFKDSPPVSFAGGNLWKEVGTWNMTVPNRWARFQRIAEDSARPSKLHTRRRILGRGAGRLSSGKSIRIMSEFSFRRLKTKCPECLDRPGGQQFLAGCQSSPKGRD